LVKKVISLSGSVTKEDSQCSTTRFSTVLSTKVQQENGCLLGMTLLNAMIQD